MVPRGAISRGRVKIPPSIHFPGSKVAPISRGHHFSAQPRSAHLFGGPAWPLELGIRTPMLSRGPLSWGYGFPRFYLFFKLKFQLELVGPTASTTQTKPQTGPQAETQTETRSQAQAQTETSPS